MSSISRTLDELYELRYNTVLDMYRRRARAYEVEVLTKIGVDKRFHPKLIFLADWAGSLAFKLDPYWQLGKLDKQAKEVYKNSLTPDVFPVKVVPANRVKKFACIHSEPIYSTWEKTVTSYGSNALFIGGCWGVYPNIGSSTTTSGTHSDATQASIWGFLKDTTDSTRNPQKGSKKESSSRKSSISDNRKNPPKQSKQTFKGNHQGEMELWKFDFSTDTANATIFEDDTFSQQAQLVVDCAGKTLYTNGHIQVYYNEGFPGPSASISKASVDSLAISEKANALSVMTKNCDRLVAQCLPARRYYNLLYQIAELRDLTSTIRGTLDMWLALEKELGRATFKKLWTSPSYWTDDLRLKIVPFAQRLHLDIRPDQILSAAYLNFKFGWQSMIEAFTDLAKSPERVTKDINRLIDANGKNVTLRSKFHYDEPMASTPTISWYKTLRTLVDASIPASTTGIRRVEVRCSVNSGLNLPKVDLPTLRKNLFNEKMGATPTPGDLYDIIPWSWLIDWVFGASDYLHLMDEVNGQRNLLNYGLITYESHMRVDARYNNHWFNFHKFLIVPPGGQAGVNTRIDLHRSAQFNAKYVLRKDVMAFAGLKDYSGIGTSNYQKSILAALFSQFSKNPGSVRPDIGGDTPIKVTS
jgi:hypothetical protein